LRFADEKVDDKDSNQVAGGEDVTVLVVDCIGDEGREEREEEVEGPVSSGSAMSNQYTTRQPALECCRKLTPSP